MCRTEYGLTDEMFLLTQDISKHDNEFRDTTNEEEEHEKTTTMKDVAMETEEFVVKTEDVVVETEEEEMEDTMKQLELKGKESKEKGFGVANGGKQVRKKEEKYTRDKQKKHKGLNKQVDSKYFSYKCNYSSSFVSLELSQRC